MNEPTTADPEDSDPRAESADSRIYVHDQCGDLTEISGYDYARLANPFASVSDTICAACGKVVPIRRVRWADSGENVAEYRKRLRRQVPFGRRILFLALGPLAGAVLGFLVGFAGGLLMIGRVGNRPWWLQEAGLIGGGVTAFGGLLLGAQLLPSLLMSIGGIDYRRMR